MPVDPGPCRWLLPDPAGAPSGQELIGLGGDLAPATLLAGYATGIFAMPQARAVAWFSPDPRGVMPVGGVHVSRSLQRSCRRFNLSVDGDFEGVLAGCADPARPDGWITPDYAGTYRELFRLGWAHSIEIWTREGRLAGGLLGVEVGGVFCGESMFHRVTDASKAAVWATVALLARDHERARLFDVQWLTRHLASLGAIEIPRRDYLRRLSAALAAPGVLAPVVSQPLLPFIAGLAAR